MRPERSSDVILNNNRIKFDIARKLAHNIDKVLDKFEDLYES